MSAFYPAILEIILPVASLLAIERFLVYRCLRTESQIEWVRRQRLLRPNFISACRYPMGFITVGMIHMGWLKPAFLFFSFWMITDITDGDIARKCGLYTEKGKSIDPLSDKLMYGPLLIYFAWIGLYNPILVGLFLLFDFTGQFSRMFIRSKAANLFGKSKTFLVVVLLFVTGIKLIYSPLPPAPALPTDRAIAPLLGFCVGLAFFSTAFKVIPNYWYANILSILNLVCGLAGIGAVISGQPLEYAFGLVFLGQFLDLFDGRAAEKWGSTPRGEIFDDVADGTSFGATVGLLVAYSFKNIFLGAALGLIHFSATAYRLIRFVMDKRKQGVEGGVASFSGMPSPGGALFAGSSCLLIQSDLFNAVAVTVSSLLMVSRAVYPHFGRSVLPHIPKILRVLVLALFLTLIALGVRRDNYTVALAIVFGAALLYLAAPLYWKRGREGAS